MSETWIPSGLCRCCHSEGNYKSLESSFTYDDKPEILSVLFEKTFNIMLSPTTESNMYQICSYCEPRLKDAFIFKQQVLKCEERFKELYLNIKDGGTDSKFKFELDSDGLKQESSNTNSDSIFLETSCDDEEPLCTLREDLWSEEFSEDDSKPLSKIKKKISCNVCSKEFTYIGSLEVHMKLHTGEKNYPCHLCREKLPTNRDLTKHYTIKHKEGNLYLCTICKKNFEQVSVLKKHVKIHITQKIQCDICDKEFRRKKGLKEHLKIHNGEKKFTCDICHRSFIHNQTLKSHMYTHTGEKPYICDICGRRFPQRTHLQRHIYIIHNQIKPFSCNICQKKFSSKSYLVIHERLHTGEKPFSCSICKKNFTAYTTLKVHERVHTGFKPYSCNFCERQFAQLASFKLHQRTHTGEKPYNCKICRKSFSDNGYLKIHMRVHTGVKPFNCDVCKRSFRETGQLKRHMRVHTGIKPYTCKICDKQIGNLSKHMKVHTEDRVYSCDMCEKQFTVNSNLKIHMKLHLGKDTGVNEG